MANMQVLVAESVSPNDFYSRRWEGHVVEEIVRLLGGRAVYRIVMTRPLLFRAIQLAAKNRCGVFHLSCHGDEKGIQLTDGTNLSWEGLADAFQKADPMPSALILSSCRGGDAGAAHAFTRRPRRPRVIFGTVGENALTFPGACISWPILYTELIRRGVERKAFVEAVDKMNLIAPHKFVYRRWKEKKYWRYPRKH